MTIQEKYNQMYEAFQNGHITKGEWFTFCQFIMNKVVWNNPQMVEIFKRMKFN